jgi:ankyrin repeat protein
MLLIVIAVIQTGCGTSVDIWEAIEQNDLGGIQTFQQEGGSLEVLHRKKKITPLIYALELEKKQGYEKLLELGADPNAINISARRVTRAAMYDSVFKADNYWLTTALKFGGNPNLVRPKVKDIQFMTPLECAINGGSLDKFKLLVDHGADLSMIDPRDGNLLAIAARRVKYDIALYLLKNGADPDFPSRERSTFLSVVRSHLRRFERAEQTPGLDESFEQVVDWLVDNQIEVK